MHHGKCQPKMFIKKTAQFPKKLLLLQEKIFCFKAWNNVFGQPLIFLTYRPHYKWWLCMIYVARYNIPINVKNKNLMYLFWYVWKKLLFFFPLFDSCQEIVNFKNLRGLMRQQFLTGINVASMKIKKYNASTTP